MLNHPYLLFFDFETTGLSPYNDQIIEVGALLLKKSGDQYIEVERMNELLQIDRPLPEKITEITQITADMLKEQGIAQEIACQRFQMMLAYEPLLIAYNIQFDLGFLQSWLRRYTHPQAEIHLDVLDVMAVYKDRHRFPHRLESAVQTYQVEVQNTHRAIDDVVATYHVLEKLNQEQPNLEKYVNKVGYNPKYGRSGPKLDHVQYVAQYGGRREIEKL
ncbi:MAG: 3'-5' exonuclease [Acholeplasmataceae bacterium]|nr:3'-5' exonuclease [Acholeplasmataceae bacterium]